MTTIIIRSANTVHFSGVKPPHTPHHEQQAQQGLHSRDSQTDKFVFHGDIYGYAHNATSDAGPIIAYNHTTGPHRNEDPSQSKGGGTEHYRVPQIVSPMDTSSVNLPRYPLSSPTFAAPPSPPTELANTPPPMLSYNLRAPSDLPPGRPSWSSRSAVSRSRRFNPINRPATRAIHRRKASRSRIHDESEDDDDDDDEEFGPGGSIAPTDASRESRCETVRNKRISSEQRRRDELRESYVRLKEIPHSSNHKATKVSLLDRAFNYIKYLEAITEQLKFQLQVVDHEAQRLRNVNEALMLNRAGTANPASSAFSN